MQYHLFFFFFIIFDTSGFYGQYAMMIHAHTQGGEKKNLKYFSETKLNKTIQFVADVVTVFIWPKCNMKSCNVKQ